MQERPWDLAAGRSSAFGEKSYSSGEWGVSGDTGCGETKNVVHFRLIT